jgi:hypothetical protein
MNKTECGSNIKAFVHVLLFQCLSCGKPLSVVHSFESRNIEGVDAGYFELHCECGWIDKLPGLTAVRHWVADWSFPQLSEQIRR